MELIHTKCRSRYIYEMKIKQCPLQIHFYIPHLVNEIVLEIVLEKP